MYIELHGGLTANLVLQRILDEGNEDRKFCSRLSHDRFVLQKLLHVNID